MNIFVISQNYYPDNFRINDITASLVKRGHEVTVLTGLPDYATSKVPKKYKKFKKRKETIEGVSVIRVPIIARRRGAVFRSLNYLSFALTAALYCRFKRLDFDVIYVYEVSPVTMAYPAVILKKKTKKKLFLYCLDLWPESVKVFGIKEQSIAYGMIHHLSKKLYQKCDRIAVTSKPFMDYLHQQNQIPRNKMVYLPQEADEAYLTMDLKPLDNKIVDFVFMGNIGKAQDVECIINAAEKIREVPDFKIHLIGDGSNYENCQKLVKDKSLDSIIQFYGRQPVEKMTAFYKLADACLLTLKCENYVGMTMPGKLQGYMAAGKPVIAAINGAAKEVIEAADCGLVTEAGNAEGLAVLLKAFIENPDRYVQCGEKGRHYFKAHFTIKTHLDQLEKELEQLITDEVEHV